MQIAALEKNASWAHRFQLLFRPRDIFVHDGASLRRIHVGIRTQVMLAVAAVLLTLWTLAAGAQIATGADAMSAAADARAEQSGELAEMKATVAAMKAEHGAIKAAAVAQAQRMEKRQAFLDALVEGKDAAELAKMLPLAGETLDGKSAAVVAPYKAIERRQDAFAERALAAAQLRFQTASTELRRMGLQPQRIAGAARYTGMGGPFEPVPVTKDKDAKAGDQADPQFRALFVSWKKLDQLQQGVIAIPSTRPVSNAAFTSGFGVRSDPFRGGAAMHAGIDLAGPIGTPIYATADGVVGRAEWANGYGNLVELDHGKGISTRYGHLSRILVKAHTRVKRGQLIALMGSTGRSTGSHLHYEVRLDGRAVNPVPFLQTSDYLLAMQRRLDQQIALGGPDN